jgi:ATP-dependent protease ClpP protease subunit
MKNTTLGKIIQDNKEINKLTLQIIQQEQLFKQAQDPAQKLTISQSITALKQQLQDNTGDKKRAELIKEIENFTKRRLITYFSLHGMISDRDAHIIEDFLISNNLKQVDILINSPGGLTDASEKMIKICQTRTSNNGNFDFRTIIVQNAKSAATLFALGSSKILLCECAELGPVDPQIIVHAPNGEMIRDSAHQIFYGSEQYRKSEKKFIFWGKTNEADILLLSKYDPVAIKRAHTAIKHTEDIIEKRIYTNPNLSKGYKENGKIKDELKIFTDHGALYSHGRPIYYEDIKDYQYCHNKFIQKFNDYFVNDKNKNNSNTAVIEKKLQELSIRSLEVVRPNTEPIQDNKTGNIVGFNKVALKLFESSNGLILTKDILN